MGNNQPRDLGKLFTNGALSVGLLGGAPYVYVQHRELQATHDTVIRLEEQNKAMLQQIQKLEVEQQHLREVMERFYRDRKVAISVGPQPAGE